MLRFEWNKEKAVSNEKKHGLRFEEAATVFGDPLSMTIVDKTHSLSEERLITMGRTSSGQIAVVVHLDLDEVTIRLISARPATRSEKKQYEQ
jgi:hypothetical protein